MKSRYLLVEVTSKCNLKCPFCYNRWTFDKDINGAQCTGDEFMDIISSINTSCNISGVTLTGGEPLVRTDIFEIISSLYALNIQVSLATNGLLLTDDVLIKLKEAGLKYLHISVHGLYPDSIATLSGGCLENKFLLYKIRKAGIPFSILTILTTQNINEIEDIISYSYVSGAQGISLLPLGSHEKTSWLRLNQAEFKKILSLADKKAYELQFPVGVGVSVPSCEYPKADYKNLKFASCICGDTLWAIDPLGNLRSCEQSPEIIGSLLEHSFEDLTNEYIFLNEKKIKNINCKTCKNTESCIGGCKYVF